MEETAQGVEATLAATDGEDAVDPITEEINGHEVRFTPTGFDVFYGASCETCGTLICTGFPMSYCQHAAEFHAGVCECRPSLVTWT